MSESKLMFSFKSFRKLLLHTLEFAKTDSAASSFLCLFALTDFIQHHSWTELNVCARAHVSRSITKVYDCSVIVLTPESRS